jgi:hypothetical protein
MSNTNESATSLRVTLHKPSGDEELRKFASSIQEVYHTKPGQVIISIEEPSSPICPEPSSTIHPEQLSDIRPETKDDDSVPSPRKPTSKTATFRRVITSSKLTLESLEMRSRDEWFGVPSPGPTAPKLTLFNVLIGIGSPILEGLVELHLDCNTPFPERGLLSGEWLLAMLSKTKNLEVCTLYLEPARMVASLLVCPPEVNLEKIKEFKISHHWIQIESLFSHLTLPEDAQVTISTTVTSSENPGTLAQVVFPSQWPISQQAWGQKKLKLDLSTEAVKYRIGDRHTITVKHRDDKGECISPPPVISGCGNPEGTVTDLEVSFTGGVEGISSEWWDNILLSNRKLDSLDCSNIKFQDFCDALDSQEEPYGIRCPELSRLVLRNVDFTVEGANSALTLMLDKRTGLECDIRDCWGFPGSGESSGDRQSPSGI